MAHTITLKLQQAAREFAATDAIGFSLRGGVKYYDRQLKTQAFTNYQALLFAKVGKQADFYRETLSEGAIVEVFGDSIKINTYEGKNGQAIVLELNNAKLGFVESAKPTQGLQRLPQPVILPRQRPHLSPTPFDNDIPF